MTPLLEVANLSVEFPGTGAAPVRPVDGVDFTIEPGEVLALVGESGCGKSLTALAILGLVPPPGRLGPGSRIALDGTSLAGLEAEAMRRVRGRRIGMVFQDPMTSLNPVLTVGHQLAETIALHHPGPRAIVRQRATALLDEVGLPNPAALLEQYPHRMSGGQRQRVLIALALAGEPDLLLADEPTTALDVTVQAQILELLDRIRATRRMAMLLITHDFGVVAGRADRVAVMYAGRIVERAPTRALFLATGHPYARGLLAAQPRLDGRADRVRPIPGVVPAAETWPAGCRFHPRCAEAMPRCATDPPPTATLAADHQAACWLHGDGEER